MGRNIRFIVLLLALTLFFASSFPALAASDSGTVLSVGSRGDQVVKLQDKLRQAGFFPKNQSSTGYFGWITYNAVVALENKYALPTDGQAGHKEWEILNNQSKTVLGYYVVDYPGDSLSYKSYAKGNAMLDQVALFDFYMDGSGNLQGSVSRDGVGVAEKKGAKTLMVVHNIASSIDKQAAYNAVSLNPGKLINNIMKKVNDNGYDGVNIDIEGIPAYGRKAFNSFLNELSNYLKAEDKLLTVAIPAKTDDQGNAWSAAYDYGTIGRLADFVVIMSYDEHWVDGAPGPVASMPWVCKVMDYSVSTIPSQKILMGIACYGYDWPQGQCGSTVKWSDLPGMISRYGNVQWDNGYSVPYLTYWKNGVKHQVWFENKYSLAIKLEMAKKYGLGGVAFWRLGYEDAAFWDTLAAHGFM